MNGKQTPEDWFHKLGTHYVLAQILFHLNQCGVFLEITRSGPTSADNLAAKLGLKLKILDCLLDYVVNVDEILMRDHQGRYHTSAFGQAVLQRYERRDGDELAYNFLDVRIGGYGGVWAGLSQMLRGTAVYGENLHRDGKFAEDGLYKSAVGFLPAIKKALAKQNPNVVVELGVNSGLLEKIANEFPKTTLYGLDRSERAIGKASQRLTTNTREQINWLQGDLFSPETWASRIPERENVLLFSLHFHEFMAEGPAQVRTLLQNLCNYFHSSSILVLEQPALAPDARKTQPENLWFYSQSNILIHHLIGNGRILSEQGWEELFLSGGCKMIEKQATGYLGYVSFTFALN